MLVRDISKVLAYYLFGFAATVLLPLGIDIYYQFFAEPEVHLQPYSTGSFVATLAVCLFIAFCCYQYGKKSSGNLYRRESIIIVVIVWFLSAALAAFPFVVSGTLPNPFQAFFEVSSGISTTGSTVMFPKNYDSNTGAEIPYKQVVKGVVDTEYVYYGTITPVRDPATNEVKFEGIEAVGKALLFWRSFTQWLGGMGFIVLFVAVLPSIGIGTKQLFFSEVAGPIKESFTPRIKETAAHLWIIYVGITILETIVLMATNDQLPFFDAMTITFSTLATGGFSIRNANIGAYNNSATEWVVIIFMIIGSINFSLYYYMLRARFYRLYDLEFMIYACLVLFSCGLASWLLIGNVKELLVGTEKGVFGVEEAIRYATFQVVSAHTCTGFATAEYDIWPYSIQAILVIVMFLGGMAGSTAGGIKTIRLYMLFKIAQYKVESLFRPDTVRTFRVGTSEIDSNAAGRVLSFFLIMIAVAVLCTFIFILDGIDPETAITSVATMINNVGLGFRAAGPTASFAFMSNFSLAVGSVLMLLGRLEFFVVLAILVPAFWKQRS